MRKEPYIVDVKAGQTYHFCRCGLSKTLPHCDGSHQEVGVEPMVETFEGDRTVYICGCFKSSSRPYCDGTHTKL
ncbi:MAG: CDGSH iron-sulfur domain-containing protein [bacterium]|nr:CDGSH iron-sulfur domain-containing protein [bacterium]